MQSKRQIYDLLLSAGVRPNKRFGQHFLIDLNLMRLLIDSAGIQKDDVVLEVGCATGSLTDAIAEKAGFCVAVEIDAVLAQIAKTQLQNYSNVAIIAADALKNKFEINPVVLDALNRAINKKLSQNEICHSEHSPRRGRSEESLVSSGQTLRFAQGDNTEIVTNHKGRLLLVANLPYVAATPLMLNLITGSTVADAMFVTVQKEVADRMTAHPGTKDYGTLSILLSATGDIKHIRTLKPTVFWPQPQVDSAIISYVRNTDNLRKIKSVEMLSRVAGAFLQHRRKMLKGCCKLMTGELAKVTDWLDIFSRCGIDPTLRPDHLTPEQFVTIANLIPAIS